MPQPLPITSVDVVQTADSAFDDVFNVGGESPEVLAVLNCDIRTSLAEFARDGILKIENEHLSWVTKRKSVNDSLDLARRVRRLSNVFRNMRLKSTDILPALARNALNDPVGGVRRSNFGAMVARFPEKATTRAVARKLLKSSNPLLQCDAATFLRTPDAIDVLRSLIADTSLSEPLRIEALHNLTQSGSPDVESRRVLRGILVTANQPSTLRITAIREIERLLLAEMIHPLLEALPDADDQTLVALAGALGALENTIAEEGLLARLGTQDPDAKIAIIDALGRIGSPSAVSSLLELSSGSGVSRNIKKSALAAITQIQARVPGAVKGGLSIPDTADHTGALSVVPDSGGHLSSAAPEPSPEPSEREKESL